MGIGAILSAIGGRLLEEVPNDYEPLSSSSGRWVNKGSSINEQWDWVEKKQKIYYINIFIRNNQYVLQINNRKRPNAIDYIQCEGNTDLENRIDVCKTFYSEFGEVIVDKDLDE